MKKDIKTLILMVGPPASGKSTFAEEISDEYLIPLVSSDSVREELYGDESIQDNPEKVFEQVYKEVNRWIKCGVCILDATNYTRWSRWAAVAKTNCNQVVYIIMDNDIEQVKAWNAARERKVPEKVIDRMFKNLRKEPPLHNECWNLHIFKHTDEGLRDFLKKL